MVKVLLDDNAQVDLQGINGMSSLMITSLIGHIDIVNLLLENNAQSDLQNNEGKTALMTAYLNHHMLTF